MLDDLLTIDAITAQLDQTDNSAGASQLSGSLLAYYLLSFRYDILMC